MKFLLLLALLSTPAIAQMDAYGRPIGNHGINVNSAPNPVRIQMQQQPGGWIHDTNPDPVKHEMRERSWIHTEHRNPVRYQMQQESWIHGSIHGEEGNDQER